MLLTKPLFRVLLVEDDPDQIFLYESVFKLKNILTIVAVDNDKAKSAALQDKPDIILLDIMLRHDNGLDILENIKADERTKNIPVIIFTNTDKKEYRDRATKLGANEFVIKSQTIPQEMIERMKKYVKLDKV